MVELTDNSANRKKAFAELVSVEVWHDTFGSDVPSADLHVDVVFGTARVGGEVESPVRCRLSLKRADVVVVIPHSEPLSIDKASVSRDAPQFEGRIVKTRENSAAAKAGASAFFGASNKGVNVALDATAEGQSSMTYSNKVEIAAVIKLMDVTQSKTPDGSYRWTIKPMSAGILEGRPWNAHENPRLRVVDNRKDRTKGIPPTLRIEVRCLREDLVIEELKMKNETIWRRLVSKNKRRNNVVAAECYIRDQMSKEGLEVVNIHDLFGELTLATATPAD